MDAVHIIGAGGIGCAVGYALAAAGTRVTFVDVNPKKIDAGNRDGVKLNDEPPQPAEFIHFDQWQPSTDATIILSTKCYDNSAVLVKLGSLAEPNTSPPALWGRGRRADAPSISTAGEGVLGTNAKAPPHPPSKPLLAVSTPTSPPQSRGRGVCRLLPIQNGFDPQLDALDHTTEGIASFVAKCETDAPHARITRPGELHIGARREGPPASLACAAGFFRVVPVSDILPIKYAKLMYNAAISPLAAAAGIDNGQLLSVPAARRLFFELLQENYRILSAAGIALGKVGPFHPRTVAWILRQKWLAKLMARGFEPSLRGTYCSMAGEIEKGRTEIDNYNGHLIRLAEQHGTPHPLNRAVFDRVTLMTVERIPPSLDSLRSLGMG